MCLAVPAKITEINGRKARVDIAGVMYEASLMMMPDAKVGEYVMIHAGFAIEKMDEDEAQKTIAIFKELDALGAENYPN